MIVNSNKEDEGLKQNPAAGLEIQDQEIVIPSRDDAQATGPQPYDPDRKSQKSTHFAEIDPDAGLRDAMNIQDDPLDIDMEWSGIMNLCIFQKKGRNDCNLKIELYVWKSVIY